MKQGRAIGSNGLISFAKLPNDYGTSKPPKPPIRRRKLISHAKVEEVAPKPVEVELSFQPIWCEIKYPPMVRKSKPKPKKKPDRQKTKRKKPWTERQYKEFRLIVLERDNYTCTECPQVGGYLEVHHIKPKAKYPELALEPDNGVTLCFPCHCKKHPEKPAVRRWAVA